MDNLIRKSSDCSEKLTKSVGEYSFLKSANESEFLEIVFARENTFDLDGDWFAPGAYTSKEGGVNMSRWGHSIEEIPVAKGKISKGEGTEMIYVPEFFDIPEAKSSEIAQRETKGITEYSYIFYPLEWKYADEDEPKLGVAGTTRKWTARNYYKVQVYEVSPVGKGASIETGIKYTKAISEMRKSEIRERKEREPEAQEQKEQERKDGNELFLLKDILLIAETQFKEAEYGYHR